MESTPLRQNHIKPLVFWNGFPVCALLLKQVAETFGEDIIILGTKSKNHFEKTEEILGHKIIWLDNPNDIWKRKSEFSDRNLIIHTGWNYAGWWKYDKYMRTKNTKIVIMVDNRYRGDFRQYIGALIFRFQMKKFFDAVIVPGKKGTKLMKFLGMSEDKIYTKLYGAYEKIYFETTPILNRPKKFLFVGQLIKRKNISLLIEAFKEYRKNGGTWTLQIIGDGSFQNLCKGDGIMIESFLDPEKIAEKMNNARVLILPSKDDNWGTVVCEAAACGMHLITSKEVGASEDIIKKNENGIILPSFSKKELVNVLFHYQNMADEDITKGSRISKEISKNFTSNSFFTSFKKIVKDLFNKDL